MWFAKFSDGTLATIKQNGEIKFFKQKILT
jgi:hypothetical protein